MQNTFPTSRRPALTFRALTFFALAPALPAALLGWKPGGPGAVTGGAGPWDTSSLVWDNAGSQTAWANTGNTASFTGTGTGGYSGSTVTLGAPISVDGVVLSNSYTFNSSTHALTLANGATITANHSSGSSTSFNLPLAGGSFTINPPALAGSVTNASQGGIRLDKSPSHTGVLTISGGVVRLDNALTLASGSGVQLVGSGLYHFNAGSTSAPFQRLRQGLLHLVGTTDPLGPQVLTMNSGTLLRESLLAGSDTMTLTHVTLENGYNSLVSAASPSSPNGDTLAIVNLLRSATATAEFRSPSGTLGANGQAGKIALTNINGSPVANTNGILGGWASANVVAANASGTNPPEAFAAWDAALGSVKAALPDKASATTAGTATAVGQSLSQALPTDNWLANGTNANNTITQNRTIHSLVEASDVFINNGATLTLASGGLLLRQNNFWMQSATADGKLTSGDPAGKLYIHCGSPSVTADSTLDQRLRVRITDNGSTPVQLIKTGNGSVLIGDYDGDNYSNNSYSGGTIIQAGRIPTQATTAFGTGPVTIMPGGQALLVAVGTYTNPFILSGSGTPQGGSSLGAVRFGQDTTISGPVTLAGPTQLFSDPVANLGKISGPISGPHDLEKIGAGTLILTGANTITGETLVTTGTLISNVDQTSPVTVRFRGTISPGDAPGSRATWRMGRLTAAAGATASFDLGATTTIGGGANDLIECTDLVVPTTGGLLINLPAVPVVNGTYRLINYSGSILGGTSANIALSGFGTTGRKTVTLDVSTPHQVNIIVSSSVADLTWTNAANNNQWGVNALNFDNAGTASAFRQGDHVTFGDTFPTAASYTVTLTNNMAPGSMNFATSKNISLEGAGILNAAGVLSGSGRLLKSGSGNLTITSSHSFTGGSEISGGLVKMGNTASLGTGPVTILSPGSLDLSGSRLPSIQPVSIAGAGPDGQGALRNTLNGYSYINQLTLTGDTTLGASTYRWDVGQPGPITINGGTFTLTKTGAFQIWLRSTAATTLGAVVINEGMLGIESEDNSFGSPAFPVTVNPGGTLASWGGVSQNKPIILAGGSFGTTTATSPCTWTGPVTLTANSFFNSLFARAVVRVTGGISGPGGLTFTSATLATCEIANTNSYAGPTVLNGGILLLTGTLTQSPLTVGGTARLSGTGTQGAAATVQSSGMLSPGNPATSPGQLTFQSNLTLNAGSIFEATLTTPAAADKLAVTGTLTANGTIRIFLSGPAAAGQRFDLADGTLTGTPVFDFTNAPLPAGLSWDTSSFLTDGSIAIVSVAFEQWATAAGLTGPAASPGADPDGDGALNLLEFATNSNPATDHTGARFYGTWQNVGAVPTFVFSVPVRAGAVFAPSGNQQTASLEGFTYRIEASPVLTDWNNTAVSEVTGPDATAIHSTLPPAGSGWEYHTFRPTSPPGRTFLRLRVSASP